MNQPTLRSRRLTILQRFGLAQGPTVLMVVGGTIFTDIASILVFAVTVSIHLSGFSLSFLGRELLELAVFVPLVIYRGGRSRGRRSSAWGRRRSCAL